MEVEERVERQKTSMLGWCFLIDFKRVNAPGRYDSEVNIVTKALEVAMLLLCSSFYVGRFKISEREQFVETLEPIVATKNPYFLLAHYPCSRLKPPSSFKDMVMVSDSIIQTG